MTIWQGIVPGMTAGKVVNNQEPTTSVETTELTATVRTAKPHELYTAAIGNINFSSSLLFLVLSDQRRVCYM